MKINESVDTYQDARNKLVEAINNEFLGPQSDTQDILIENPVTRYATGMIFPVGYKGRPATQDQKLDKENDTVSTDEGAEIEEVTESLANSFFPSVTGLSFYCLGKDPTLNVELTWTTYAKLEKQSCFVEVDEIPSTVTQLEEFKSNFMVKEGKLYVTNEEIDYSIIKILSEKSAFTQLEDNLEVLIRRYRSSSLWVNKTSGKFVIVDPKFNKETVVEGLELICNRRYSPDGKSTLFTLALKNAYPANGSDTDEEHVFFNIKLKVTSSNDEKEIFTEYTSIPLSTNDPEEMFLALLYRKRKAYAVGHGSAVNWEKTEENEFASSVCLDPLPTFELPQVDFNIPDLDQDTLSMLELSGEGKLTNKEIINKLNNFCSLYKKWIDQLESKQIPEQFRATAKEHIKLCEEAHSRMVIGVDTLTSNQVAMQAFKLANKAMLMQSLHSNLQKQKRLPEDNTPVYPDYKTGEATERAWRPFQLGFLLMSIIGMTNPNSNDRKIVDLIWFPTGGGKTEAYLGISSFTIFYRRLTQKTAYSGTVVMMRYTLRLLTAQQFQRACTLICAMEKLRRENPELLGQDEISIGLWVGSESTPNTIKEAEESFMEFISSGSDRNPSPLLSCPWCGTKMLIEKPRRKYPYKKKSSPPRANLYCFEKSCEFKERLPVLIVDEEIYAFPPTLLFGTVDKFAQMPMQKGVSNVFAANKNNLNNPPELIIQDELHLISGALGTMVGLYETAIDFLCSRKSFSPKIIASTATVRHASEQCRNLFNRETRQFPPSGLEISDSFFAKDTSLKEKPGRLYLGLMPSGKTQTTSSIRLAAILLRSVFQLEARNGQTDDFKDKYWTLVSYFNSIRELGGFISLLNDDIPLYANALKQRYGGTMRPINIQKELTSRKRAEEIPEILEQLSVSYPDRGTIDVLSATNMISVGIDIDRLGLMMIRGQPKLTSEYIQVSSRIGRRIPGLIVTLYNSARTRDRAHYERFRTYHESFYRYVEPSSVTPFSSPARARALSAVLITMIRHGLGVDELNGEGGASLFSNGLEGLNELKTFILDRVRSVDIEEEKATKEELDRLSADWEGFIKAHSGKVVYKNKLQGIPIVGRNDDPNSGSLWILPTSMRNVDVECNVDIRDE